MHIMASKIFHGDISPSDFANALVSRFNQNNYTTKVISNDKQVFVQITTSNYRSSGGHTSLTVSLTPVEDGVSIDVSKQNLFGVVASLGQTAISTLLNPVNLITRLDDLAQDIESIQLSDEIWMVIQQTARGFNASHQLSDRLRRLVCGYCGTANIVGESRCIACGAPLGDEQPTTCRFCGYVIHTIDKICPNCGKNL